MSETTFASPEERGKDARGAVRHWCTIALAGSSHWSPWFGSSMATTPHVHPSTARALATDRAGRGSV